MGFNATVTPDDLRKGDLIKKPGIKALEFVDYTEKEAKSDQSTNLMLTFDILDGEDKGLQLVAFYNEKALAFGKDLWAALGIPSLPGGGFELSDSIIKSKIGTRVKAHVKRGKNKGTGKDQNEITEFLPFSL